MVELTATLPLDDGPLEAGGARLRLVESGPITALAPYKGAEARLSAALQVAHGMGFAGPGQVGQAGPGRCIWAGLRMAWLVGVRADEGLAAHAALSDLSDGWVCLRLEGAAEEVLARLTPLDLRRGAFPEGRSARSELAQMPALFVRDAAGFEMFVMRSMARSAWGEIALAMQGVAARG
ncbi:heterotetrameric sarcosine oxidase gamma subunit [Rhodovulum iodosum]|uniref:Heterotetrameric sarcosine oxidase gamma subunit n=1 Tax=Rhodovulum iodosum TaxID=68291 RepID=A0ABV3XW73_9RHOB|nr:sarcosine oxidase subunit gamma [Rhodovulum robiginosum]